MWQKGVLDAGGRVAGAQTSYQLINGHSYVIYEIELYLNCCTYIPESFPPHFAFP